MRGLKNVRTRRTDALSQLRWEQLESLLAAYYRAQGYTVDHCGTGASRARFDGGIDLKLRKDDAYILVQCKHSWSLAASSPAPPSMPRPSKGTCN